MPAWRVRSGARSGALRFANPPARRLANAGGPAAANTTGTAIRRTARGVAPAAAAVWPSAAPVSSLPVAHRQRAPIEFPAWKPGLGREFCRRLAHAEFGECRPQTLVEFGRVEL